MTVQTIFSALSDPTRFAIVEQLLEEGDQTAGSLAEPFNISKPAISRHLRPRTRALVNAPLSDE